MNWNEFYGYSCDAGVKKAYQDKVGNAAEINLMLNSNVSIMLVLRPIQCTYKHKRKW
jgi:hypothetical protein